MVIYKYEDMADKKFEALNAYLGFATKADAEVPSGTGKEKIVCKKAYGDLRHWYTEADVALCKPADLPYMEAVGYDCDDGDLSSEPKIEPEFSSQYMQGLPLKPKKILSCDLLTIFHNVFFQLVFQPDFAQI